ncbi:MAG: CaiB/BaiF CoA transferase family protein [Pigmentiphaga sp.]
MLNTLSRPLEGFRVLDLTVALSGPYATLMLAGLGAEVIRVEAPGGSDISRTNPPFAGRDGLNFGANEQGEMALTTLNRARNKKSITLDLKSARGQELLSQLVRQCDVLVENMSEGTMRRLQLDYAHLREVNPRLVYASIKAFGEPSNYPTLKGMDIIVQALSGVMDANGFADGPPTRVGLPVADMLSSVFSVQGILAALLQRSRTGEGQHVQVSMLDCLASWVAEEHFDVMVKPGLPTRSGNFMDRLVPFGVYPTRDGHVAIVAFQPDWFRGLLEIIGKPEWATDPRFSTRGPRLQHAAEVNQAIQDWTSTQDADAVVEALLTRRGIPSAKVRTPREVVNDAHLQANGAVTPLVHPRYGEMGAFGMGIPIQFSHAHVALDQPAVELGDSNEDVYGSLLNLSTSDLAQLREAGII